MENWYNSQLRIWNCQRPVAKSRTCFYLCHPKQDTGSLPFWSTHFPETSDGSFNGKYLSHFTDEAILDVFSCAGSLSCALHPDSSCSVRLEADLDRWVPQPLCHAAPHNTHVLAADGWQGEERGRLGHLFPGLAPCVVLCLTKPEPLPTDLSIRWLLVTSPAFDFSSLGLMCWGPPPSH